MLDTTEIQKKVRNCLENLHSNKIENYEDIDKFLGTYDPSKLKQDDKYNLNRQFHVMKSKMSSKAYQSRKVQDQRDSQPSSIRPSKKNQHQYSLNYLMK